MRRDVIVMGASAGGVEALRTLISQLPEDLPAAVLVVLHVPSYGGSVLPAILGRVSELPIRHATPGEKLQPGTVLVAPPDRHLVIDRESAQLSRGPRENGHRPAIDVLFRSAARFAGARTIGVVLSGVLDDGTAGLSAIATRGGMTVVQDPADALYPGMPTSAIEHVPVDHVTAVAEMAGLLVRLCKEETADIPEQAPALMEIETDVAMMDEDALTQDQRPGTPSGFSCPDCAGVLWEIKDGHLTRYRCRVGHAWSSQSLLGEQTEQLESALWMALRGLEEKAALSRRLRERAVEQDNKHSARRFDNQEREAMRAATTIRSMLESNLGEATGAGS